MRRPIPVLLLVLALFLPSFSLGGCAGSHAAAQPNQAHSPQKKRFTTVGRLDDPQYLFAQDDDTNAVVVKAMAYIGSCSATRRKTKRTPRGAWGDPLPPGTKSVAISRDLLAMGLEHGDTIQIEGLPGEYKVLDLMHPRHKKAIDIYYGNDLCGARQWGKRVLTITWK